jgi:type IV secretory pathway VirB9-like protein
MKPAIENQWKRQFVRVFALVIVGALAFHPTRTRAATAAARVVKYAKEDIIPVRGKLRFSTLIVLPESEEIVEFTTGDKEFWIINGSHNLCYVHPAQAGIRSNLNLITATGHVYSFLLTEISNEPNADPDLKLFIEPKDQSSIASTTGLQGFVRVEELEAYKKELAALHSLNEERIHSAERLVSEEVSKFRQDYSQKVQFDYNLDKKASRDPFLVSAIYHDDSFTYIKSAAREKPALYEVKDGKPNLINFQFENGVYIAPKVLDEAYLVIGKNKVTFKRHE